VPEAPLPPLGVDQLVTPTRVVVTTVSDAPPPSEPRVTLTAANADVRDLLPLLAEAGGFSIVLAPDVAGLVSVHFDNVPVSQAMEAVLREAGLSSLHDTSIRTPWSGPVLFYQLPVHVDSLDAAAIRRRFSVGSTLAEWMVEVREKKVGGEGGY
jgi:hypothetical protein